MRRLFTLTMLTMLLGALLPLAGPVSAQGWDPCGDALNGVYPDGYAVVWAPDRGGSGSQIVLGSDGDDYLKGGSGDDILCGYAGNDVLEGNSGNDWMDAGAGANELYGNSGNDTLIGMEGDVFVGNSGTNEIIANTPSIDGCALANTYDYNAGITPALSGLDLAGCVLDDDRTAGRFWYANFAGADLSGAYLRGDFDYADFTGVNLSGATIVCNCDGNDFSGATLSGVTLLNTGFREANLAGVDLSYSRISSFLFINSNLSGADFTGADISFATFYYNFTYANFTNATFELVSFIGADLTGADFTGADVGSVQWVHTTCPDGTFVGDNDTCEGHLIS